MIGLMRVKLFRSHMYCACGLALALFARAAAAGDDLADAKRYLEGLYAPYLIADAGGNNTCLDGPFDKCFASDLAKSMEAERKKTPEGDVGVLDFDPFVDGQDWQISNLQIDVERGPDGIVGIAKFKNFEDSMEVKYDLVPEGSAWKIKDMRGKDWDLRQLFAGY